MDVAKRNKVVKNSIYEKKITGESERKGQFLVKIKS